MQRIHVIDRQSLQEVTNFGDGGRQPGQFFGVHSIASDSKGNLYTTETWEGKRIQKFTGAGTYLTQWGSFGSGDGEFKYPYGVAVNAAGEVYVADFENYRIQKFRSAPTPAKSTTWGHIKSLYR